VNVLDAPQENTEATTETVDELPSSDEEPIPDLPDSHLPPRSPSPPPSPAPALAEKTTSPPKKNKVTIEEVFDDDDDFPKPTSRFAQKFPASRRAGAPSLESKVRTVFEELAKAQRDSNASPYQPFADKDDWELGEWLSKNVGKGKIDEYLALPIVSAAC
jgi:hypothetical protein